MNLLSNVFKLSILLISLFYFSSCEKDDVQARESMVGNWNVVEIRSLYANFTENGFNPIETISEQGQFGTFNFEEGVVDFTFTRNDTLFTGNSTWNLTMEKQQSGFFMENRYTLDIENEFIFDVAFGDRTQNSEKNAQEITFRNDPNPGPGVAITMVLEKN